MKKFNKYIGLALATLVALGTTSCLEEAMPTGNTQTADQVQHADKSSFLLAIPAYMTTYSSSYQYDTGFSGFGVMRDCMTADLPVYGATYDYFADFGYMDYLGNYPLTTLFWRRYYYLLQKANSVIAICDRDPESEDGMALGTALTYRAMVYLDMMRLYEYKSTGVARLDEFAENNGLYGLTVPLITEATTEAESRNLPRDRFEHMFRFILTDLNDAEIGLRNTHTVSSKDMVSLGVVYGMKARLWLEIGTRLEKHADDLAAVIAAESNPEYEDVDKLEIKTANEAFANAALYARKAINEGYTPVTSAQWYDPINGFNTPNNSWMWCIIVNANNGLATSLTWQSIPSYLAPEATYGVSYYVYGAYRMIDSRLFSEVNANDWRRDTWIDPNEVADETAFNNKYAKTTQYDFEEWSNYTAYCGFKFHPAQGAMEVSTTGNITCTPLMRIEEMYLIEAEAKAHSEGPTAGKQLLENFMNSYRMNPGTNFVSSASALNEVVDEVFRQKRIEFWGEGIIMWDYKRLEKSVTRGYPGTNHFDMYRFNSYPDKVAPWMTLYIPDRVFQLNPACKLNPDPTLAIPNVWTE